MPPASEPKTDELIARARTGNAAASDALLNRYRERLKRMITVRMDPRLARRIDPSDVVQDTLTTAVRRLPQYCHDRPVAFYPWLRQIAWNRLVDLHRRHIQTDHRSLNREVDDPWGISDDSITLLAGRLGRVTPSPSSQVIREELTQRVKQAMQQLPETMREVLVLRHLEDLSIEEVAATMGVSEGTVKSRHFRALTRLRDILERFDQNSKS